MVLPSRKLNEATCPEDIVKHIHETRLHEGSALSIRFFCGTSEPDAILLMIDAGDHHSRHFADALGGLMFGGVAACRVVPVRADFRCSGRREGRLASGSSCDICNLSDWSAGAVRSGEPSPTD